MNFSSELTIDNTKKISEETLNTHRLSYCSKSKADSDLKYERTWKEMLERTYKLHLNIISLYVAFVILGRD